MTISKLVYMVQDMSFSGYDFVVGIGYCHGYDDSLVL